MDARLRHLERTMAESQAKLEERRETLKLTADQLEKRLFLLNELRSDVMTKSEYIRAHESVVFRLERVEAMQSRFIGVSIALVAMAGAAGAVLSHLLK
jgi:hypothetical protein